MDIATTPFGRRPMTLAMLASQKSRKRNADRTTTVDKWKSSGHLRGARPLSASTDRALAVLNALLSFYPDSELSSENG